jgi:hypothetical protein
LSTKTVYVTQAICDVIAAGPHASEPEVTDRAWFDFLLARDVDLDYCALLHLHGSEGLEDAVFVFCGDGPGAWAAGTVSIFIVASGELVGAALAGNIGDWC